MIHRVTTERMSPASSRRTIPPTWASLQALISWDCEYLMTAAMGFSAGLRVPFSGCTITVMTMPIRLRLSIYRSVQVGTRTPCPVGPCWKTSLLSWKPTAFSSRWPLAILLQTTTHRAYPTRLPVPTSCRLPASDRMAISATSVNVTPEFSRLRASKSPVLFPTICLVATATLRTSHQHPGPAWPHLMLLALPYSFERRWSLSANRTSPRTTSTMSSTIRRTSSTIRRRPRTITASISKRPLRP